MVLVFEFHADPTKDFFLVSDVDARATEIVLAGAGDDNSSQRITKTAEIFDPSTGQWTLTGSLQRGRTYGALGKLRDGRVLIAGGYDQDDWRRVCYWRVYQNGRDR
jgi:hypothetical protein